MKAILLCPGPSLANYKPPVVKSDLIVGVNRAAIGFKCDVWCCGDAPCAEDNWYKVIGQPKWLTLGDTQGALASRNKIWPAETILYESFEQWCSYWQIWRQKCETTASWGLLYCAYVGATEIECHGVDWKGNKDWDGHDYGNNRSDLRWKEESELWQQALMPWLSAHGVSVVRV